MKITKIQQITKITILITLFAFFTGCGQLQTSAADNLNNENKQNQYVETANLAETQSQNTSTQDFEDEQKSTPQQKQIFYDFRKCHWKSLSKNVKVTRLEADVVFKYLFGADYKRYTSKFEPFLKRRVSTMPVVETKVSGSFTKSNSKETLYTVWAGDIKNDIDYYIVIFDGTTPVFKGKIPENIVPFRNILLLSDLNNDGKNELLLEFSAGGSSNVTDFISTLVEIQGNNLNTIQDFGEVSQVYGDSMVEGAALIYYFPTSAGNFPKFEVSYYSGECGDKKWKRLRKSPFE